MIKLFCETNNINIDNIAKSVTKGVQCREKLSFSLLQWHNPEIIKLFFS